MLTDILILIYKWIGCGYKLSVPAGSHYSKKIKIKIFYILLN